VSRGPWPLTERVLHLLPGSRTSWAVAWAASPLLQLFFADPAGRLSRLDHLSAPALWTWVYANLLLLFGLGWVGSQLYAAGPLLARLASDPQEAADRPLFRWTGSVTGPLLLTLGGLAATTIPALIRHPSPAVLGGAALRFIALVPPAAGLWVYVAMLVDIHRVGRMRLTLLPFEEDRSLGLRPLGAVAFSTFLIVTAVFAPVLVYSATGPRRLAAGVGLYLGATALILAALYRLHRLMLAVKREHVAWARGRYARAVKAVRGDPSGASLRAHAEELQAAESLERHAASILEWPVDDVDLARAAVIITGVVAATAARLLLARPGP